ncbi:MAG: hypothetical protein J0L94_01085 [Rhodothermia bacterium]|nr:hypothetical protein [Rhodothermia bacterium]
MNARIHTDNNGSALVIPRTPSNAARLLDAISDQPSTIKIRVRYAHIQGEAFYVVRLPDAQPEYLQQLLSKLNLF